MSLTNVRSYFNDKMIALGFTEHENPFDNETIANTVIGDVYRLETSPTSGTSHSMSDLVMDSDVTLHVFIGPCADLLSGIDSAILRGQDIIKNMLLPADRLTGNLKDVVFNTMTVEPFDASNDNIIEIILSFTAKVIIDVTT